MQLPLKNIGNDSENRGWQSVAWVILRPNFGNTNTELNENK